MEASAGTQGRNGTAAAVSRTREEFVARWRCHVAGMALFGVASDVKDGPLARAARVLDIPGEVERLLGLMWDDLTRKLPKTVPPEKRNEPVPEL